MPTMPAPAPNGPPSVGRGRRVEALAAPAAGEQPQSDERCNAISFVVANMKGKVRTETLARQHVTIGRDRESELLLAGEGVSRHHATVSLGDDGLCIITDLGSTNGTFVNHRNIARTPTKLYPQDRVDLGEFVFRAVAVALADAAAAPGKPPASSTPHPRSAASQPPGRPAAAATRPRPGRSNAPGRPVASAAAPAPRPAPTSASAVDLLVAGGRGAAAAAARRVEVGEPPPEEPLFAAAEVHPREPSTNHRPSPQAQHRVRQVEQLVRGVAQQVALATLDAGREPDEALVHQVEIALDSLLAKRGEDGMAGPLREAVLGELLGVGPLEALFQQPEVRGMRVRGRQVFVDRGAGYTPHTAAFADAANASRALVRLLVAAGGATEPGARFVRADLPEGWTLFDATPLVSPDGHLADITRTRQLPHSLQALVREDALASSLGARLEARIRERANILVVGFGGSGLDELMAALATATGGHHALWLTPADGAGAPADDSTISTLLIGEDPSGQVTAVEALSQLGSEHLFAPALMGAPLAALVDLMLSGRRGVIAALHAATVASALARAAAIMAAARPGLTPAVARAQVAAAFEVAVAIARSTDGALRVTEIGELDSSGPGDAFRPW